ncbi:MAG: hypothetical protein E7334_10600 [Clostridiales bacterium]|nr:hypothetical protein [Clostridiales bacterium]
MKKAFIKVINSIVCVLMTMAVVFTGNIATASANAGVDALYWIDFDADGGTVYGALTAFEPAEEIFIDCFLIPDDAIPQKEGFNFLCWEITEGTCIGEPIYPGDSLSADNYFVEINSKMVCKLKAIWEPDPDYKPEVKEEPKSIPDAVETVEVIASGGRTEYTSKRGSDIEIFFKDADINQFSGFAMDYKTTAVYSKDYNVTKTNGGVMLTLSKGYLETLDKGNHTAILFFTRNNPKACGTIALGDLIIE